MLSHLDQKALIGAILACLAIIVSMLLDSGHPSELKKACTTANQTVVCHQPDARK